MGLEVLDDIVRTDINFLLILILFMTSSNLIYGAVVNFGERYMPDWVTQVYKYGKSSRKTRSCKMLESFEFPKRWFVHFYMFAVLYVGMLTILVWQTYLLQQSAPRWLISFLNTLATSRRECRGDGVDALAVLTVTTLLFLQVFRRLYECLYVHVFSEAKINLLHYVVGYLHYFNAGTAILVEAVAFTSYAVIPPSISITDIRWNHVVGAVIFIWAWIHQFQAHLILRSLRKGATANTGYWIPEGDLFDVVSCPHYFTEMLMYVALGIVLGLSHVTWIGVTCWVVVMMANASFLSHFWYLEKFENYPRKRKAFIPYLL